MKRLSITALAVAVSLALCASAQAKNSLLVQFFGPSELVNDEFLDKLEDMGINPTYFTCFETTMVDAKTKLELGTGVDCLKDVSTLPAPTGVDAVSFFNFPGGTLVSQGKTSIVPFIPGYGNGGTPKRTHVTGSIPTGGDSIINGTKGFKNATGTVRVSGAVALADTKNGLPFFDCLWEINLD
ncbi:MAG: hypothetical protein ABFS45_09895 [Pseudomonadota bacterium]